MSTTLRTGTGVIQGFDQAIKIVLISLKSTMLTNMRLKRVTTATSLQEKKENKPHIRQNGGFH